MADIEACSADEDVYTDTNQGTEFEEACHSAAQVIVTTESASVYRPTYTLGSSCSVVEEEKGSYSGDSLTNENKEGESSPV